MPHPAYLMSMLARQLMLGEAGFRKRYPDSWLVWESEPTGQTETAGLDDLVTRLPRARYPERPSTGDPLCFPLEGPDGTVLTVGRSAENLIVIAEESVSRKHCRLTKQAGVWQATRDGEAMPMSVGRQPVMAEQPTPLSAQMELTLGNVLFTVQSTTSLIERLKGGAASAAGT